MECYETGILSKEELDGIELNWGNGDDIVAILEKMCKGEGVGKILMNGSKYAADYFGKGHDCLVVSNGVEEAQHDSRLIYGLMRIYQYDPTPGRHVKGGYGFGAKHMAGHDIDYRGTGYQDINGVSRTEVLNSSGCCMFGQGYYASLIDQIEAVTGFSYSAPERLALGLRMFMMRHAFNVREGMRRKDYVISKRFSESNPPIDGPIKDIKVDKELLADNFFNALGLDLDTVPMKSALTNLGGLELVLNDLYPPEA
jgi:aldehyde:ferredoxin oxidoreductase